MSQFFKEYSIFYKLNGGNNNTNNPIKYNTQMDDVTFLPPTRPGYTFEGWFKDAGFLDPIESFSPSEQSQRNDRFDEIQVPFSGINILAVGTDEQTSNTLFYTWGYAKDRRLGFESLDDVISTPYRQTLDFNGSLYLGARSLHYIKSGELYGIGRNNHGILSTGDTTNPIDYVLAPETKQKEGYLNFTSNNIRDFKVGRITMAIVDQDGDLYITGYTQSGKRGDGTVENTHSFTKISTISNVSKILIISEYTLVVQKEDRTVWVAGFSTELLPKSLSRLTKLFGYDITSRDELLHWRRLSKFDDVDALVYNNGQENPDVLDTVINSDIISIMAKFKDKFTIYGTNTHNKFGIPSISEIDVYSQVDISHIIPEEFTYNSDVPTGILNSPVVVSRDPKEKRTILPADMFNYQSTFFPLLSINYNDSSVSLDYYNLDLGKKVKSTKIHNEYINEFDDISNYEFDTTQFIIKENRVIIFGGHTVYRIFTFELSDKILNESYSLSHNILYSPIPNSSNIPIKQNQKMFIGINSMEAERDISPKAFFVKRHNLEDQDDIDLSKDGTNERLRPIIRDKRDYIYDTQELARFPELSHKSLDIEQEYIPGSAKVSTYIGQQITDLSEFSFILDNIVKDINYESEDILLEQQETLRVISLDRDSIKILNIDHIENANENLIVRDIGNRQISIGGDTKLIYPYLPITFREIIKLDTINREYDLIIGLYYNYLSSSVRSIDNSFESLSISELDNILSKNLQLSDPYINIKDLYSRALTDAQTFKELKSSYKAGAIILGDMTFYNN